jgi:hypothetical protein
MPEVKRLIENKGCDGFTYCPTALAEKLPRPCRVSLYFTAEALFVLVDFLPEVNPSVIGEGQLEYLAVSEDRKSGGMPSENVYLPFGARDARRPFDGTVLSNPGALASYLSGHKAVLPEQLDYTGFERLGH